jgi:hypothetical protein
MILGFDIFRHLNDGSPLWIAQADTLDDARKQLDAIRQLTPGSYFIRDASTGQAVLGESKNAPGIWESPELGLTDRAKGGHQLLDHDNAGAST